MAMSSFDQTSLFKDLENAILEGWNNNKDEKAGASSKSSRPRKSFNELFSAKEDVDVDDFHIKCDGKGPTVTILYGKYNTVFGGYTSQDWSPDNKKKKRDENAFLFYKNDHAEAECVVFRIKKDAVDKAITCDKDFGPTFGGGDKPWHKYDLQTFKRTPKSKKTSEHDDSYFTLNGHVDVQHAYQLQKSGKGKGDKSCFNGGSMSVKTIEVYQVVDDRLKEPWRIQPKDWEKIKQWLEHMEPLPSLGLHHYNILLVGVIGSGKSSFYNTLATVFENKVKAIAAAGEQETSVTNEVHAYDIIAENGKELNIKIFDIRGFEEGRFYEEELELILDGKIQKGYVFDDQPKPELDVDLTKTPTLNDEIHLVCLVVDSTKLPVQSDQLKIQVEVIKRLIRKKGLPLVAVATKFDQLCPKISENADHVYNSPKARDETRAVASKFGIQLRHVFPIVNYIEDEVISPGKNKLALQALHTMVQLIQDYLQHHKGMPMKDDSWSERGKNLSIAKQKSDKEVQMMELETEFSNFESKELRVLCCGSVHCGKSSFIDSILSTLMGKICSKATGGYTATSSAASSTTEKFQMYEVKYRNNEGEIKSSHVFFGDMPGIEEDKEDKGVKLKHAQLIVKGHVPNKCKIKDGFSKDSKKFITKPEAANHRMHCVCFVFDISTLNAISDSFKTSCNNFQKWLSQQGIPYIVVATKGDKVSKTVRENALQVYENKLIKEGKDKLIEMFNFRENIIFPVRNYIHETHIIPELDALLLDAFRKVLTLGQDHLEDPVDTDEEDRSSTISSDKEDE